MHVSAHLDVDVVALESDDDLTVMLELQAPAAPTTPAERPEHTAVVVLDRSGSMGGERLDGAKRALAGLVAQLDERDRFGLVTFDHQAEVAIPAARVGDTGRDRLLRKIAAIQTRGSTDLSAGYFRGLQEARRVCTPSGATVVLISDGHANSGITDSAQLQGVAARAGGQAITTSTIGVGTGYDDEILAALATGGRGNHAFALDGDAAAAAIGAEIDGLLSKSVQAASMIIKPSEQVAAIELLNDVPAQAVEGGVMADLGDLYAGETRRLVVKIHVPTIAALGLAEVAQIEFSYVSLPDLVQHTVTLPIQVNVVPADVAAGRVRDPRVVEEALFANVQKLKKESLDALRRGDVDGARASLNEGVAHIDAAPAAAALDHERSWLQNTLDGLDDDLAYTSRRLHSDMNLKSRGSLGRSVGGEMQTEDDDDLSH